MAYTAWSVVYGEQPTAAKWNQLGANDAGFKDGTNIDALAITPPKLANFDWHKYINGTSFSSIISGTWNYVGGNSSTGGAMVDAAQNTSVINDEIQYKTVLQAGTYKVLLHCDKDVNRGIATVLVDGVSIGTVDMYNATRQANVILTVTSSLVIAASKLVTVNIKIASKNGSSGGYYITLYAVDFIRTS